MTNDGAGLPETRSGRAARVGELLAAELAARDTAFELERWLSIFRRGARDALTELSLTEVFRSGLRAIAAILEADAASVLIASEDGSELIGRAAVGLTREVDLDVRVPAGQGVSGRVLSSVAPLLIDELDDTEVINDALRTSGLHAYAGVPLVVGARAVGVLHVTSRAPAHFSPSDIEVLSLLGQPIAAAIERVRLFEAERTTRRAAEEALAAAEISAARLDALQRVTATLAGTATVAEICEVILHDATLASHLPGARPAIWGLAGSRLVLLAGEGNSESFPELPLDDSLPAAETIRTGKPNFVESHAEIARRWPVLKDIDTAAFAGLPLAVGSRKLGLLAIGFSEDHHFSSGEREFLNALGDQAAIALARAEDQVALEVAIERAEERQHQLDFINTASAELSSSLDLDVTIETIARLSVPSLSDRCALYLLEGQKVHQIALAPELSADEREFFESSTPSLNELAGVGAVLRTGKATYREYVDESMFDQSVLSPDQIDLLKRIGIGGVYLAPLQVRGRILGALGFVNRSGRVMTETERQLAEELVARAAVAIDNAQLYIRESNVAKRLAASLLPSGLPQICGMKLAARHLAGSAGLEVGGDFYDCFGVAENKWMLVVGDVQGKGVEAAALTGLARHTIRSMSLIDPRPASVLRHLNTVLLSHAAEQSSQGSGTWDSVRFCTALLVLIERGAEGFSTTVASGGHPLPLLRRPDGSVETLGNYGALLGVEATLRVPATTTAVEEGCMIVCYTDGVSERRRHGELFGAEGIAALLARSSAGPDEVADALLAEAVGSDRPQDDVVVLVTSIGSPGELAC